MASPEQFGANNDTEQLPQEEAVQEAPPIANENGLDINAMTESFQTNPENYLWPNTTEKPQETESTPEQAPETIPELAPELAPDPMESPISREQEREQQKQEDATRIDQIREELKQTNSAPELQPEADIPEDNNGTESDEDPEKKSRMVSEMYTKFKTCEVCHGSGRKFLVLNCPVCRGTGSVPVSTSSKTYSTPIQS